MKTVLFLHSLNYISSNGEQMSQARDAGLAYFNGGPILQKSTMSQPSRRRLRYKHENTPKPIEFASPRRRQLVLSLPHAKINEIYQCQSRKIITHAGCLTAQK